MKTEFERFINKVEKTDSCWNWIGAKYRYGYGHFRRNISGKWVMYKAHRYSYEYYNNIAHEDIRDMFICHTCDNPSCVNPSHLFVGTAKENTEDKLRKNRHGFGRSADHVWLSFDEAQRIRKVKQDNPNLTYKQLGIIFGVSSQQAHRVITNKIWKRKAG